MALVLYIMSSRIQVLGRTLRDKVCSPLCSSIRLKEAVLDRSIATSVILESPQGDAQEVKSSDLKKLPCFIHFKVAGKGTGTVYGTPNHFKCTSNHPFFPSAKLFLFFTCCCHL